MDARLEESARVLGAGQLRTFWSVTLPLSMDGVGVMTGCILVFVLTDGSFLNMLLLGRHETGRRGTSGTRPLRGAVRGIHSCALERYPIRQLRLIGSSAFFIKTLESFSDSLRSKKTLVSVVVVSFSSASFAALPIPGYGLRWYRRIFEYTPFLDAMLVSAEVALGGRVLAAALGVPAALALARARGPGAAIVANLLLAPVSVPAIVLGCALLCHLSALEVGISLPSLLVAHTVAAIPYLVRTLLAAYRLMPG